MRLQDGSTEFNLAPLPDEIARHLLAVTFYGTPALAVSKPTGVKLAVLIRSGRVPLRRVAEMFLQGRRNTSRGAPVDR